MTNQNILFTCAGRRNYLINYFKEALNGKGNIIAADSQLLAPALVDADIALKVPDIYDDNYITALIDIIETYNVNAIISLNDLELPILAKNKSLLEKTGVKVIVSNEDVIAIGFDKWKTFNFIKRLGLNTPKTYITLESAINAIKKNELTFPLVLKPRWGSGSIGIEFPESMEELEISYQLQKIKLKNCILNRASDEDIEHAILIQEKLNGREFGMDVVNDFNGNYFGTFVREKLAMRFGETDKAVSIIDQRFEDIGQKIGSNLKHIGNMDCDAFLVNNDLYILELNPRFGGGYPFSHEAGANIVTIYLIWLKGLSAENTIKYINYKSNITFSKCDRLIKLYDESKKVELKVFEIKNAHDIKVYNDYLDRLNCKNPYYDFNISNTLNIRNTIEIFNYFVFEIDNVPSIIMPFYKRQIYINNVLEPYYDVSSPYGYSGPFYNNSFRKEYLIAFWEYVDAWYLKNNIISEFIRFSLKENHHHYSGKLVNTLTNIVGTIDEEDEQWKGFKQKVRNNYKRAVKEKLVFKIYAGNIKSSFIETFYEIYISTMERNKATEIYYYSMTYFKNLIQKENNKYILAFVYKENVAISAELLLKGGEILYSFLGGTLKDYFSFRPNDFLKVEVLKWARDSNLKYYSLGGGRTNEDTLYTYKKCFFPLDKDVIFYTGKKIINKTIYDILVEKSSNNAKENDFLCYFPEYRETK